MHRAEMCKGFGLEHLKNRDCLEDTGRSRYICMISIEVNITETVWESCTGFIWFRFRISGRPLNMVIWTCRFHKRRGISQLPVDLVGFQGLCCVESVALYKLSHICANIMKVAIKHYKNVTLLE